MKRMVQPHLLHTVKLGFVRLLLERGYQHGTLQSQPRRGPYRPSTAQLLSEGKSEKSQKPHQSKQSKTSGRLQKHQEDVFSCNN